MLLVNLSLKITKSYKIAIEHGEPYFPLVQFDARYYGVLHIKVVQNVQKFSLAGQLNISATI